MQQNVKRRMYTAFRDFTRDCTLIFHNAKVYNRPSSNLYKSAELLEGICKTELGKFAKAGTITREDATLPYIGELPPPSPEASIASLEVEESVEDEEEEEEDEEDEDEEDEEAPKKRRGRPRKSITTQPRATRRRTLGGGELVKEEDVDEDTTKKMKDDPRRKRGRPPRVETPMEIRAKNIQKALKKFKDDETGENKLSAFDKLPEKKVFPEYYQQIGSPISMDIIKVS
jgi:chromatin structure-remodeling complex subunit RSC1/2